MNGFPQTYSVDPESTGQKPHDQIDNLIAEHEGSSLFNLLSFLTEPAPGYSPLKRMGEKETLLQKVGEIPTLLMGLGLLASPQGARKAATKLGSRRVLKEFGEEVADPLYHNTKLDNLLTILKEGNLKGHTRISFSRDPRLRVIGGKGETPAQIIVSKEEIRNLGKIEPRRFRGQELQDIENLPRAEELKGFVPPFKHEAEEVFFTPQRRHKAIEGIERKMTAKRFAKVPTEKFEGIHIDKFMFEPGDNIATTVAMESAKPRGKPDQPVIQYITELMREAHKRKVPIILGPEATETFYKLGMDKKLPKSWQGRLVTDEGSKAIKEEIAQAQKLKPKVPALKTKSSEPLPGLDRLFKKMVAEKQGKDILFDKFEQGIYPEDIVNKFFSEVYPNIGAKHQKKFRYWSQTGEYYPGLWNPKTKKFEDVPFHEQVKEYIYETFPNRKSFGGDIEDHLSEWLEGLGDNPQSRGGLSFMSVFNDAFDLWKASSRKIDILPPARPKLLGN